MPGTLRRINRSALILAILVAFVEVMHWLVRSYVPDGELASILRHLITDVALALGIVSNSRPKGGDE